MKVFKIAAQKVGMPAIERDALVQLLPHVLAWQRPFGYVESLHLWYLLRAYAKAQHMLYEIDRRAPSVGKLLLSIFEHLSESGTGRFVGAPETYNRSLIADAHTLEHVPFFESALMAEQARVGREHSQPCWSALGDFYSVPGTKPLDPRCHSWGPKNSLAAPLIGNNIPIDFWSPYAQNLNSLQLPFEPYSTTEIAELSLRLSETFSDIETLAPHAAHLISLFIKVIVLRKDGSRPSWSGTSSTPSHIGRTIFRNGQRMDIAMMAEGLVHEATHSLLYSIELLMPFVATGAPTHRLIQSPWSGNRLSLRTYLHACLVWYSLANFWNRTLNATIFTAKQSAEHLSRALAGFRSGNPIDSLASYIGLIDPLVLEVVSSLRDKVDNTIWINT